MKRFTKSEAQAIRVDINRALAEIENKYGAKVDLGGIKYGASLTVKLTFNKMSEDEHGTYAHTKEAQEFIDRAYGLGLSPDVLNETIIHNGQKHVILGYSIRAKRYPIKYTVDGQPYKCTVASMKTFVRSGRPEFFL